MSMMQNVHGQTYYTMFHFLIHIFSVLFKGPLSDYHTVKYSLIKKLVSQEDCLR